MTSPADLTAALALINAAREQTHTNIAVAQGWSQIAQAAAGASGSGSAQAAAADANRAEQQKGLAETARVAAETARTGAQTARTGAETARTGAETARDAAVAATAGKADLDGGKLRLSQLPDLAISQFLGEVATQAAMLALSGQRGDWCTRTDLGTAWMVIAEPSSTLGAWRQLTSPASPVQSVAGKTGAVTLTKGDVGLGNVDNTTDAAKPISTAAQAALDGKAGAARAGFVGWYGTTAEYNALPAGTRNAAGFIAVITP